MDVHLHHALNPVRVHLTDTASRADKRRLKAYGRTVSCRPRCTGCCSRLVAVSMAEAMIAYEYLRGTGKWAAVRARADAQLPLLGKAGSMTWFKMRQKCPILDPDTGLCQTYAFRPAACSTHFATSNPELCDPWSTERGRFRPLDFTDLFEKFEKRMSEAVQDYGIFSLRLPVPSAVLLAERVSVKSGLDLSEVVSLFFKEL
jgi:Fe-S-cluster containining protein